MGIAVLHRVLCLAVFAALLSTLPAQADTLVEPHLHIVPGGAQSPQVALTLDACSGGIDHRILDTLIARAIPATIFVTGRWLHRNPETVKLLLGHPELFELEDHGENHLPAVIGTQKPYGLRPAGTAAAVAAEIENGASSIGRAGGPTPHWYRGATALYSRDALQLIPALGFRTAGFSLNADLGASVSAKVAAARIDGAKDGDVIIAHVNQPKRAAGAGVALGVEDLLSRGYRFVRLADVAELDD